MSISLRAKYRIPRRLKQTTVGHASGNVVGQTIHVLMVLCLTKRIEGTISVSHIYIYISFLSFSKILDGVTLSN